MHVAFHTGNWKIQTLMLTLYISLLTFVCLSPIRPLLGISRLALSVPRYVMKSLLHQNRNYPYFQLSLCGTHVNLNAPLEYDERGPTNSRLIIFGIIQVALITRLVFLRNVLGTPNWKWRLSTVDLLMFSKKENDVCCIKSRWSELVCTRRSTVLSLPLQ